MKRKPTSRSSTQKKRSRSGSPWPSGAAAPELDPVEKQTLAVVVALRAELGREPKPTEVSARLGLRDARASLATVRDIGLPFRLTRGQERCMDAIAALMERHGRSPSTREVSEEMGLSPSGSRFHINGLVRLGLVTKPEVQLVLRLTDAGAAYRASFHPR